jgi:DNA-binding MarR family transcriptional regulator
MSSQRPHPGHAQAVGYLLIDGAHAISERILRRLHADGFDDMRMTHLVLAQHFDEERGSRLTDLAAAVGLTKPTVVKTINELVALGYCVREPDPEDGRAKLVVLTERGRAATLAGARASVEFEDEWAARMGRRRFAELRGLLAELVETVEAENAPDAAPAG